MQETEKERMGAEEKEQCISTDSTILLTSLDFPQKPKIFNPKNGEGISSEVLCKSVGNFLIWTIFKIYIDNKIMYVYENTIINFLC